MDAQTLSLLQPQQGNDCPYKADDESHRRLQIVRNRKDRAASGQRPADDDYSKVAKTRRRLHDKGIYEYPMALGKNRIHPTQKNLQLFEELIKKHRQNVKPEQERKQTIIESSRGGNNIPKNRIIRPIMNSPS